MALSSIQSLTLKTPFKDTVEHWAYLYARGRVTDSHTGSVSESSSWLLVFPGYMQGRQMPPGAPEPDGLSAHSYNNVTPPRASVSHL